MQSKLLYFLNNFVLESVANIRGRESARVRRCGPVGGTDADSQCAHGLGGTHYPVESIFTPLLESRASSH